MSPSVIRRMRLPANRRTPAAAREVVRTVLAEADLNELLDPALLLTTELSTNGVLHARTEIDLEVVADGDGLTVTVNDFNPRPLTIMRTTTGDMTENGRGLLLVDHFATGWGTTHHPKGKGVWFRLARPGTPEPISEYPGTPGTLAEDVPSPATLAALVEPEMLAGERAERLPGRLLSRLAGALGATSGAVRLDRADGHGLAPIAEYGLPTPAADGALRVPVPVPWPWRAELVLTVPGPAGPYARPLATLVADRLGLILENDRLRHADLRRQSWLTFLAEASELLAQSLDVDLTMALIPQLVVPRLGQWCAVYNCDEWGEPRLAAAAHADETSVPALVTELKRGDGADSPAARLREAVRTGAHMPLSGPVDGIAVPMVARGQRLGALAVGRHQDSRHDPEETAIIDDVARRAALALDNARIHAERRRVAQTLQQSLLPPALPVVAGITFGAEYVPTQGDADVGGDFYDVVPMPDGRWLVVIGDVSGKGVQAATVTGLVRDVIRVLARDGRRLTDIITRLNETLVERGGGRYCTLAMAAVGFGSAHRLDVALHLAGHDRPVKVCADGKALFVGVPGTALGLLGQVKTPHLTINLDPGDTLVFYTDGVTERRRGAELFGIQRLLAAAGPLAGYGADVVAARLRATALAFSTEPPRDDIAVLALRNDVAPEPLG